MSSQQWSQSQYGFLTKAQATHKWFHCYRYSSRIDTNLPTSQQNRQNLLVALHSIRSKQDHQRCNPRTSQSTATPASELRLLARGSGTLIQSPTTRSTGLHLLPNVARARLSSPTPATGFRWLPTLLPTVCRLSFQTPHVLAGVVSRTIKSSLTPLCCQHAFLASHFNLTRASARQPSASADTCRQQKLGSDVFTNHHQLAGLEAWRPPGHFATGHSNIF